MTKINIFFRFSKFFSKVFPSLPKYNRVFKIRSIIKIFLRVICPTAMFETRMSPFFASIRSSLLLAEKSRARAFAFCGHPLRDVRIRCCINYALEWTASYALYEKFENLICARAGCTLNQR